MNKFGFILISVGILGGTLVSAGPEASSSGSAQESFNDLRARLQNKFGRFNSASASATTSGAAAIANASSRGPNAAAAAAAQVSGRLGSKNPVAPVPKAGPATVPKSAKAPPTTPAPEPEPAQISAPPTPPTPPPKPQVTLEDFQEKNPAYEAAQKVFAAAKAGPESSSEETDYAALHGLPAATAAAEAANTSFSTANPWNDDAKEDTISSYSVDDDDDEDEDEDDEEDFFYEEASDNNYSAAAGVFASDGSGHEATAYKRVSQNTENEESGAVDDDHYYNSQSYGKAEDEALKEAHKKANEEVEQTDKVYRSKKFSEDYSLDYNKQRRETGSGVFAKDKHRSQFNKNSRNFRENVDQSESRVFGGLTENSDLSRSDGFDDEDEEIFDSDGFNGDSQSATTRAANYEPVQIPNLSRASSRSPGSPNSATSGYSPKNTPPRGPTRRFSY